MSKKTVRCVVPVGGLIKGLDYTVEIETLTTYNVLVDGCGYATFSKDMFEVVKEADVAELNQSQKKDAGKSDPLMIEEDLALALQGVNAVLDYGKAKYGSRGGWKQVDIERYRSAQARHRRSVMIDGLLAKDDESGLLHQMHEACNALFILQDTLSKMTPAARARALKFNQPEPVNK